jgi:transmembrane sensor
MPDFSDPLSDAERLDLEASAWLVKRDRGFTPAEQDEYFQWLAADARHGEALARQQRTWRELDLLAQWCPEHAAEPNPDLLARPAPRPRWGWRRLAAPLALAASLVLLLWWRSPASTAETVAADPVPAPAYQRQELADGSSIELNGDARVVVAYNAAERRVVLEHGEALFTVTPDPSRPFVVRAGGVDVRALGTAFNVRLADGEVEVTVTEGRVGVVRNEALPAFPGPLELGVGQRARVVFDAPTLAPEVVHLTADEIAVTLAWQPRLLDFDAAPLHEVVAAFNRHGGPRLRLADPATADYPIVASIRSDNVEAFVRLLELSGEWRVELRAGEFVLHPRR